MPCRACRLQFGSSSANAAGAWPKCAERNRKPPSLAAMIYRALAEPFLELMLMIVTHIARAGLSSAAAAQRLAVHGANVLEGKKPPSVAAMIYRAVAEPFVGLMLVVAIVTACPPNSSYSTFGLIMVNHLHQCIPAWHSTTPL